MQRNILQHCVSFPITKDVHIVWITNIFWRTVIFLDTSVYVTQTIRESICIKFTEKFFTQNFLMHHFWKFYIYKIHSESCSVISDSSWPHGLYSPWNSPGQNTGVGSLSLLQEIFPTQGLNPLNSIQFRDWIRIAGGFFTSWATREAQEYWSG